MSTASTQQPYQSLLISARQWHKEGQYKEAVILAQSALELFTEKSLGELYIIRNVEFLKPVFESLLINYNLANTKVSHLYIALSEDPIKQQEFWMALQEHTELRNRLVHEGQDATAEQSQASLEAVQAAIDHIQARLA